MFMLYFILITYGGGETSDKGGILFCLGVLITDGKAVLSFIRIDVANHAFGKFLLVVGLSNGIYLFYFWKVFIIERKRCGN